MPFLIRIIAQRLLIFIFSFLAFLGINPEINIPTDEEINITEKEQKEIVQEVLQKKVDEDFSTPKITEIEQEVQNIVDQLVQTQTQTQEVVENVINVPKIETTETGLSFKSDFVENVVVNIVCVNRQVNKISLTTGSGVLVSSSGLILTNSHVANSFLFDDKNSKNYKECSVRRENIPNYGFNAELVYLPSDWILQNKSFFTESNPKGSGENDYALLAITSNINPVLSLPSSFEHVSVLDSEEPINEGINILIAAYPGVHTGVFEVDSNAKLKKADSYIEDLITFNGKTIDLVSSGPNQVAQRGSSGGGVFWAQKLLGLITTTDQNGSGSYLNALTLPYIIRDFKNDTSQDFIEFITRNKNSLISDFEKDEDYLKGLVAEFL